MCTYGEAVLMYGMGIAVVLISDTLSIQHFKAIPSAWILNVRRGGKSWQILTENMFSLEMVQDRPVVTVDH